MFLLFSPVTLCIIAALFPALFLMRVIYRQDKIEKEPGGLLLSLIFMGVLAALAAMVLENIGQAILTAFVSPDNPFFVVLFAFLVVALAEEGAKYFLMRKKTWMLLAPSILAASVYSFGIPWRPATIISIR